MFVYQGDGDLASIGMAETVHAAARGENITIIFINNSIYGMTGGQMAPTTLIGQKATTCQSGRDPKVNGYPIRVCELLATLDAPYYIERVSTHDVKHVMAAKKAIEGIHLCRSSRFLPDQLAYAPRRSAAFYGYGMRKNVSARRIPR